MGRRSTLVAFAAVALAMLVPASSYAAAPATGLTATPLLNSVTLTWTPDATDVPTAQAVLRETGACNAVPGGGATSTPVAANATTFTDTNVPNGTYCYYVQSDNAAAPTTAYSAGVEATVSVDTTAPIANTPTVTPANPVGGVATEPLGGVLSTTTVAGAEGSDWLLAGSVAMLQIR